MQQGHVGFDQRPERQVEMLVHQMNLPQYIAMHPNRSATMRQLTVFNSISLDGCFTDANNDMSWAHQTDPEWQAFTNGNAKGESEVIFGRVTYQMMAGWWPSPAALKAFPQVAKAMNEMPKVVFSRTLQSAEWSNSRLVKDDLVGEVRRMKADRGPHLLLMGSGTIIAQLTQERLIDEYQIVTQPVVLGAGRSMFEGVKDRLKLKRTKERSFANGCVVAWYEPER